MTDPSATQPRGTNGHKPTEFSERTFSAPDAHSHLMPAGDITVLATNLLPGDTVFCRGADDSLIEMGDVRTVGPDPLKPSRLIIHLHNGSVAARRKDAMKVHRSDGAPEYEADADTHQVLRVAYHARTDLETLTRISVDTRSAEVLAAVVGHANASEELINVMTWDAPANVQLAAIGNPVTGTVTLRRLHNAASHAASEPEPAVDVDTIVGASNRVVKNLLKQREDRRDRIAQATVLRDAAHAALDRRGA